MRLFFFGADDNWRGLCENGFHRRNSNILKAFVECNRFEKVYVVKRIAKHHWFSQWKQQSKHGKVKDIIYCSILPEKKIFRIVNRWLAQFMVLWQAGVLPDSKDLVWCYWPGGYKDANYLNVGGQWIFDADHNIIEDPNLDSNQLEKQERILEEIAYSPKIKAIASGTRSMLHWFEIINPKVRVIRLRNGVDLQRFNFKKNDNSNGRKTVIGYCGTLSRWINWDWLIQLIDDLPDCTFRFIGRAYKDANYMALETKENVELLGFKSAFETPKLIKEFDVAIGLYQAHPALDVDSMKLYEYLAANIPVVVNRFHPFLEEDFGQNLLIADTYYEFKQFIGQAIKLRKENNNAIPVFLTTATWEKRVNDFIDEYTNGR